MSPATLTESSRRLISAFAGVSGLLLAIGTGHAIVALDPCDPETVGRFTAAVAAWRS